MRKVKRGDAFASYGGYLYVLGDPVSCVRAERLSHPRGDGDLLRAGVLAKKASVGKALGGGPNKGRRFVQDYGPRHVNQLSPLCCCFIV